MAYLQQIVGIIIAALFTQNIVLRQSWGICPFLGVSKKTNTSIGMGLAVIFVMAVSSLVTYIFYKYVMVPLNIEYLRIIVFILIIASLVQLIELVIKKFSPALYNSLGVYLPLITTNCAVLKIAQDNVLGSTAMGDVFLAVLNGALVGAGFMLALILMAGVREKNERGDVPRAFRGFPIALVSAAIIAMAFYGFSGLNFFS